MLALMLSSAIGFETFAFIQGDWCAQALGGEVIERWEAPFGNAMTGSMTVEREGRVVFHEFFALVETDSGWQLRLKHFHPNLASWEEKDQPVVFPLISAGARELRFEGLTMRGNPAGTALEVSVDTGDAEPLVFDYRRCKAP